MLTLRSEFLEVVGLKRKSSAKMLENIKPGEIIQISLDLSANYNKNPIKITRLKTGESVNKTITTAKNVLDAFEFHPLSLEEYRRITFND